MRTWLEDMGVTLWREGESQSPGDGATGTHTERLTDGTVRAHRSSPWVPPKPISSAIL